MGGCAFGGMLGMRSPESVAECTCGRLKITKEVKVALDAFNLFDRKASDIDYCYASRPRGDAAGGVNGIHFHPVIHADVRRRLS